MDERVTQLKKKLMSEGRTGLALDIDETLSDTGPHWWEYLMKRVPLEGITLPEVLKKYQFMERVPEWKTEEARRHIKEGLQSNEFNETVPLLHDANTKVRELEKFTPIVAYISARPESVQSGTEKWLAKHYFPEAPVILRPGVPGMHGLESKNTWKTEVLMELYPHVSGIVDDNDDLLPALADAGYQGTVWLYGMQVREVHPEDFLFPVIISPTWDHVLDHFRNQR